MNLKFGLKLNNSKIIFYCFFILFFLPTFILIPVPYIKAQSYSNISAQIAYEMINNNTQYPSLIILDVREQWEYDENHLCSAILIPLDQINARINELEPYKDTEIIVYCRSDFRSTQASQNLANNHNFTKIYNMLGGINAWIDAGYSVCNSQSQPTISFSHYFFLMMIGTSIIILLYTKKRKIKQIL
ncbi:MAG: rhodanese-like domain-containing protein [Candidatus Thorarchaeota archaeon]